LDQSQQVKPTFYQTPLKKFVIVIVVVIVIEKTITITITTTITNIDKKLSLRVR